MLPRLRVLAYQPTRPHLRLIRLPELEIEPSPVPLNNAGSALITSRREGWIAFSATGIWGVPVPLNGRAFRVSKYSFDLLPSRNDRAIWISDGTGNQPGTYFEYDGQAGKSSSAFSFRETHG